MSVCSVELLLKIGTLLSEMIGYEKILDSFIDMLCRDEVILSSWNIFKPDYTRQWSHLFYETVSPHHIQRLRFNAFVINNKIHQTIRPSILQDSHTRQWSHLFYEIIVPEIEAILVLYCRWSWCAFKSMYHVIVSPHQMHLWMELEKLTGVW
jgi:Dynein associated protein